MVWRWIYEGEDEVGKESVSVKWVDYEWQTFWLIARGCQANWLSQTEPLPLVSGWAPTWHIIPWADVGKLVDVRVMQRLVCLKTPVATLQTKSDIVSQFCMQTLSRSHCSRYCLHCLHMVADGVYDHSTLAHSLIIQSGAINNGYGNSLRNILY